MHDLRCPKMDILGNRLIEAYRKLSDTEMFADSALNAVQAELDMISAQEQIVAHRQECFLCRTAQCRQETLKAFAMDEPIWHGTMAS
ncbi:hypothetical protein [Edaphobacter sp. HDX4]|uniref:hypothetical protein n=1 Tax=Edaphobacter sp. HDX4 TaxID=2794064 RepID=UPI002FE5FE37